MQGSLDLANDHNMSHNRLTNISTVDNIERQGTQAFPKI